MASVTQARYSYERMFAFTSSRPTLSPDVKASLRPVSMAKSRLLPLDEPWSTCVPGGGLRRGTTTVVQALPGQGGLSVALSLLSAASALGHWSAVVGVDDPGVVAMQELGVDLRRVLFVPRPRGAWAESVGDLLDGVDLLIVRPPSRPAHGTARKLMDRVRERGTALIVWSDNTAPWPLPADLVLHVTGAQWRRGAHLEWREIAVRVGGRGEAARGSERVVQLPAVSRQSVVS